ncbi:uncharacterized protein C8Q71DRAFT_754841 [Rhodofomes roseus]|uniref:Uncharacterized protein n=1 Tax=Rhodofomes roseus TaxID=34475 RepID=A0ABQ8KJ55_9APHY|nr:uncharacterized protein C8Q71DRAFT_754841 [Rhodofomes roseus]KAH9837850.1 hypothetical protein C8Q71DRAFT_754841 [Rhodofomes roseus]
MEPTRSSRTVQPTRSSRLMWQLRVSSLDPPGTRRGLPVPFAFSERRPESGKVLDAAPHMEPFNTLPRILIPSTRYAWKPPCLHYAWLAPEAMLLDYAKKNKLNRRLGRKLNVPGTMRAALLAMIIREGVADISQDYLRIQTSPVGMKEEATLLVAVYTNFDLKRADLPSDHTIEKIRQRLGMEGPPRWYLDSTYWYWEPLSR